MKLFTPSGFLARAAAIVLAFGLAHALGWREETRFLSGTPANAKLGALYLLLYFGAVLVAPSLAFGAAFLALFDRRARSGERHA